MVAFFLFFLFLNCNNFNFFICRMKIYSRANKFTDYTWTWWVHVKNKSMQRKNKRRIQMIASNVVIFIFGRFMVVVFFFWFFFLFLKMNHSALIYHLSAPYLCVCVCAYVWKCLFVFICMCKFVKKKSRKSMWEKKTRWKIK